MNIQADRAAILVFRVILPKLAARLLSWVVRRRRVSMWSIFRRFFSRQLQASDVPLPCVLAKALRQYRADEPTATRSAELFSGGCMDSHRDAGGLGL